MFAIKNESSETQVFLLNNKSISILSKEMYKIEECISLEDMKRLEVLRSKGLISLVSEGLAIIGKVQNIIANTQIDFSLGTYQKIVLQENAAITFKPLSSVPCLVFLQVTQDEDGSHTMNLTSESNILGTSGFSLTSTAGRTDILRFLWNGSVFIFIGTTQNLNLNEAAVPYLVNPTVVSAANTDANKGTIAIVFNIEIAVTNATGWTCLVGESPIVINSITGSNNTITAVLARDLVASEVAIIHYNHLTGNLTDENGRAVTEDYSITVTNNAT